MRSFRYSIKAIIIKEGKLLTIIKKIDDSIFRILPGGGHEFGETIGQTVVRECEEETGLQVKVHDLLFVRDYIGKNHEFADKDKDMQQTELFFRCEVISDLNFGESMHPDTNQIGVEWIDINRLDETKLYPSALKKLIPGIGKEKLDIYLGDCN